MIKLADMTVWSLLDTFSHNGEYHDVLCHDNTLNIDNMMMQFYHWFMAVFINLQQLY